MVGEGKMENWVCLHTSNRKRIQEKRWNYRGYQQQSDSGGFCSSVYLSFTVPNLHLLIDWKPISAWLWRTAHTWYQAGNSRAPGSRWWLCHWMSFEAAVNTMPSAWQAGYLPAQQDVSQGTDVDLDHLHSRFSDSAGPHTAHWGLGNTGASWKVTLEIWFSLMAGEKDTIYLEAPKIKCHPCPLPQQLGFWEEATCPV